MKFLDQAKIYVASGKGGRDVLVFAVKNILSMAGQMVVMVEREVMLYL
jgi:GTPase involved in cell partitioning and DNA repair